MPIIFICNRRSIKQITQKCSEGKIELFFRRATAPRGPGLKKKRASCAGDAVRNRGLRERGYHHEGGGFRGVWAAENSSPRASIWSSLSPPGFSPALESYFLRDVLFSAMKGLMRFARPWLRRVRERYPCDDICIIFCWTQTYNFHGNDMIFCG